MIERKIEQNYIFKHPLATIKTEVELGISPKGRKSISQIEIKRLSRLAAKKFFKENYRKSIDSDFSLSAQQVRAIMVFFEVENQEDFGRLIGCGKSKVSKILNSEQRISRPQAQLALVRLAMELETPGANKYLLGISDKEIFHDEEMHHDLNELMYGT